MKLKQAIGTAAILAVAAMPPAGAKEIGGGELVWLLVGLGLKHAFMPSSSGPPAAPAQMEGNVCATPWEERPTLRKPSPDTVRPGDVCLRLDYVFECLPFAHRCEDQPIQVRAGSDEADARSPRPRATPGNGGEAGNEAE